LAKFGNFFFFLGGFFKNFLKTGKEKKRTQSNQKSKKKSNRIKSPKNLKKEKEKKAPKTIKPRETPYSPYGFFFRGETAPGGFFLYQTK